MKSILKSNGSLDLWEQVYASQIEKEMVMSTPARTIAFFGVYMLGMGFSFLFIPNTVLPPFGFEITTEVWIRVLGLLVMIVGMYYLACARYEVRSFFQVTVFDRVAFCIGLVTLAFLNAGNAMLVVFGLIDLSGAVWTWLSLRALDRQKDLPGAQMTRRMG